MKHIKKLDVLALAEVYAVFMAIIGLVTAAALSLLIIFGPSSGAASLPPGTSMATQVLAIIVVFPVVCFAAGFIMGLLSGWLYNSLAKAGFGIKMEMEDWKGSHK